MINCHKCIGCTACAAICPKKAITYVNDNKGFKTPKIDKNKCINCHLCEQVCPLVHKNSTEIKPKLLVSYAKDESLLSVASSGGIFPVLANYILDNNGIVCGAIYENKKIFHIIIDKKEDLNKLFGSKYSQSDMQECFINIKQMLLKNKKVLFVGTPCQVKGLKLFLMREYNNLYTCDFICHGIPSPKVFEKYLELKEKQYKSKITNINFRYKEKGWKNYKIKIDFSNNKKYVEYYYDDPYMKGFLKNIYLNDNCYNCQSKGINRLSDLTLGDAWGIDEKYINNQGTSLIIINTDQGQAIYNNISNKLVSKSIDCYNYKKNNPSYLESTIHNEDSQLFYRVMEKKGIKRALKKFKLMPSQKRKIIKKLSSIKQMIVKR